MTYGFMDFLWLQVYGWILIVVLNAVFGGFVNLFTRGYAKKHVIAASFKDTP